MRTAHGGRGGVMSGQSWKRRQHLQGQWGAEGVFEAQGTFAWGLQAGLMKGDTSPTWQLQQVLTVGLWTGHVHSLEMSTSPLHLLSDGFTA